MPPDTLSPSRLAAFERCPRQLWLMTFRPDSAGSADDAADRRATAHAIAAEARRQMPDMVMIDPASGRSAASAATGAAIATRQTIAGAQFFHDGVQAIVDILEPDGDGWRIIAVRGSTKAKPDHLAALATQAWVAAANGLRITSVHVRHLDRDFTLDRSGDRGGLFVDTDVTALVAPIVATQGARIGAAKALLTQSEPAAIVGDHCHAPYTCAFTDYCHAGLPAGPYWPVTILPRGAGKAFLRRGIDDLTLVPVEDLRSDTDRRVHRATMTGQVEHDPAGAAQAMAGWSYPRIWLDFETVSDAVPVWPGCSPYEQVPFQFVADVEAANHDIVRHEFLNLSGDDPRRACAEALAALPRTGAVIAWHARFERDVVLRLARAYHDLAAVLDDLAARIVDLLPVTRDHWYHRDQRGSWSIKAVLPTIAPHLDYATLAVRDGGDAVAAYREAVDVASTPARRAELDAALRLYCGRDVEAMRVVAERLIESGPASPVA